MAEDSGPPTTWRGLKADLGGSGISSIQLPSHAVAIAWSELAQQYGPASVQIVEHVAAQLRVDIHRALELIVGASLPGALQIIQFVRFGDQPGVFAVAHDTLTEEGKAFVDAIVGYFDQQGTFSERTGEIVSTRPKHEIEMLVAIDQLRREIEEDPHAPREPSFQYAMAYVAWALKTSPRQILTRFKGWKQANPDRDAGEFVKVLVPDDERGSALGKGYKDFVALTERLHQHHQEQAEKEFPSASLDEWIQEEYPDALDLFSNELRVSKRIVREILDRWASAGVISFARTPAQRKDGTHAIAGIIPNDWPVFTSKTERGLKEIFEKRFKMFAIEKGPDGRPVVSAHKMSSKVEEVAQAIAHAARQSGLSPEQFDKVVEGLRDGTTTPAHLSHLTADERKAVQILEDVRDKMSPAEWQAYLDDAFGKKPPAGNGNGKNGNWPRPGEHTYMRAIESQYGTLTTVLHMLQVAKSSGQTRIAGMRIDDMLGHDAELLKRADTFCWFEEPILAVEAAAERLPDSVRLTRDLAEHHACWWYFTLPQDIPTTDVDDAVQAMLWGWDENRLHFSTYVQSDRIAEGLIPTARFSWVEGETLAHALRRVRVEHQHRSPEFKEAVGTEALMGEEETVRTVERLLRFFIAGCLWVQQTILVTSKGHIERHARKRMEKPNGFDRPLSDVQIIMLRRRESVRPDKLGPAKTVDWQCQWIVGGATGFWRNQWYPSKGHYQLKWIGPYIKGPADKPLKVPQHRVYAVSR